MSALSFAIVLPARYGSTRFPGKPLALVAGRPLIEHVYRRALRVRGAARTVVATDDDRIARAVRDFGGEVVMTRVDHATGTDRVAEVAESLDVDVVVNLQGDEPVFDPATVERMVTRLADDPSADLVTACHAVADREEAANPNVVKVVLNDAGRALYFSRSPIPSGGFDASGRAVAAVYRHVGVYAFRRTALLRFASLPRAELERAERLEQLRALAGGMTIAVIATESPTIGVDVPADVKYVEKAIDPSYTSEV